MPCYNLGDWAGIYVACTGASRGSDQIFQLSRCQRRSTKGGRRSLRNVVSLASMDNSRVLDFLKGMIDDVTAVSLNNKTLVTSWLPLDSSIINPVNSSVCECTWQN